MRVLHVVPAFFSSEGGVLGGAERYAFELARHMADEVPTTLVSFADKDRHESVGALRIRVIGDPWYVRGQRYNPIALPLLGEIRKADVVHCHQQHVLASSLSALICRASGRRAFVTNHGGGGWDISAYVSTDGWYHGHLCVSEFSRSVYRLGENASARVVYGGVDPRKFSPADADGTGGPVLFVGRLLPHKGVDDLVRAVSPDMPLEIIGQPYDARFVGDLRTLAAGKEVTFRFDCGDSELIEAYRGALCVVLPSVYRTMYGEETPVPELLGQTLLEGMACGIPAICTAVAAMPEVVEDGVTGFVVPPNDPVSLAQRLQWLRDHPAERRSMGEAARRRVLEKFTWPAVVKRCLEAYRDGIGMQPGTGKAGALVPTSSLDRIRSKLKLLG